MTPGTIGIVLALGAVAFVAIILFIRTHVVVCAPNEAVIFSGGRRGSRILRGGRGFRRPLVESVHRISLNTIPIEVFARQGALEGNDPVARGRDRDREGLRRYVRWPAAAVERFLGKSSHEIRTVARQTLEGSLRGVLANLSPEEANASRLKLSGEAAKAAREDFDRLGLVLDTLQVQHLGDGEGYLEAIGRKRSATVRKDALVAEARADAEARDVAASSKRDAVVAETAAETAIVDAEHAVRMRRAERDKEANEAEAVAGIANRIARVKEERELESVRVERNELREKANTVVPAEAASAAAARKAEGKAASIREDGRATADAMEVIKGQWEDDAAREIMLFQMLPQLVDKVTHVLHDNLHVERLTVVDNGDGNGIPTHVRGLTGSVAAFLEQIKTATGVDVPAILSGEGSKESADTGKKAGARGPLGHKGH